jgi:hypothetical protein
MMITHRNQTLLAKAQWTAGTRRRSQGRSRGGLSTKIHALADAVCDLVAALLGAGLTG